jgi:hypothetical protein
MDVCDNRGIDFSCTGAISAVVNGSDGPCGRKTANRVGASKFATPRSWALARLGKAAYVLVPGRDFFIMSFFEGEN